MNEAVVKTVSMYVTDGSGNNYHDNSGKKSMSTGILAKFSGSRFVAAVLKLMTVAVITVILK